MPIEIPPDLLDQVSKGTASLFLGAGASSEAGFPVSRDFAKFLVDSSGGAYSEILKNESLDTVADVLYYDKNFGRHWVRQKVIEYIEINQKKDETPSKSCA
jgi:hypothetical protein